MKSYVLYKDGKIVDGPRQMEGVELSSSLNTARLLRELCDMDVEWKEVPDDSKDDHKE